VPHGYVQEPVDVGQVMVNATTPDLEETLAAYHHLHVNWPQTVEQAARCIKRVSPDLVIADVSYISLAAAARVSVPGIGLCSLNWADVFRAYYPEEEGIHTEILRAYADAELFIRVEPAMPMIDLDNTVSVGPIGRSASPRRADLDTALGIEHGGTVVMVSLGGIPFDLPIQYWPTVAGVHWLIDCDAPSRPDVHTLEETGLTFQEALASVDALVIKLGYGLSVEAALAGRPILYLRRGHFPDESSILEWIEGRIPAIEIDRRRLIIGDLEQPLRELLTMPTGLGAQATGAAKAAELVLRYL
jgi:hypothetical protein